MKQIALLHVHYMPMALEPGILYISNEFGVAGHMCPCGCGNKVITPLGPTDWSFTEVAGKATLEPSIGNWQLPCKSHYWIINSEIEWSYQWTHEQIKAGRKIEERQRKSYYKKLSRKSKKQFFFSRFVNWILRK